MSNLLNALSDPQFLWGVASSLAASAIVLIIAKWRHWIVIGLAAPTRRRWRLAGRLESIGLINFFASRADYARYRESGNLSDYLATARHRIDVAGYWMGHGHETEAISQSIVKSLERVPGMIVRIALIDPNGPHVDAVASYLDIPVDEMKNRLLASLNNLARAREKASESARARFAVLTYTDLPLASVIMLDYGSNSGRIQLDFKLYRRPRSESFSFELSSPSDFYDRCTAAWIKVVDNAKPYAES